MQAWPLSTTHQGDSPAHHATRVRIRGAGLKGRAVRVLLILVSDHSIKVVTVGSIPILEAVPIVVLAARAGLQVPLIIALECRDEFSCIDCVQEGVLAWRFLPTAPPAEEEDEEQRRRGAEACGEGSMTRARITATVTGAALTHLGSRNTLTLGAACFHGMNEAT